MNNTNPTYLQNRDDIVRGYLATLLWADCMPATEDEPYESGGREGLIPSHQLMVAIREECALFVKRIGEADLRAYLETYSAETFGHDFRLTSQGHGAGFWDRGLGELGDRLTAAAGMYSDLQAIDNGEGGAILA